MRTPARVGLPWSSWRPCPLQILAAQERTTVGGYGRGPLHQPDRTQDPCPSSISPVSSSTSPTASMIAWRFRSELEVEDAKVEGGKPGRRSRPSSRPTSIIAWGTGLLCGTGLVLAPIGIINETHEPPTFNGVERPGFDTDVIPTTLARRSASARSARFPVAAGGSHIGVYLVNGPPGRWPVGRRGDPGGTPGGPPRELRETRLSRGGSSGARPGVKIGGSFWYGGTAEHELPRSATGTFGAPVALVLGADATLRQRTVRAARRGREHQRDRRPGNQRRLRAVRRQPHRRAAYCRRGPTI